MLAELARRLHEDARHALDAHRQRWRETATRLRLLSPEHVLERGFSITHDAATGAVLRDASRVQPGQKLQTRLRHGEITSTADGGKSAVSKPVKK